MHRPGTRHPSVDACVDAVLAKVGQRLVVALPLGIGKPNQLVNALVRRAGADPSLDVTLLTALTLRKPAWRSELERRLIEPMNQRLFADYPPLEYDELLHARSLPSNVTVSEFFFTPGSRLADARSQQEHTSSNYTDVVRSGVQRGINVLVQMVGAGEDRYSLSGNTDITLDLLPRLDAREAAGEPTFVAAQVNRRLPYMTGEAELGAEAFDGIVDDPSLAFEPFATPNEPVGLADAAIALYASLLVRDGGTIQLGIGALGDAIADMLIRRHREPDEYRALADALGARERHRALIEEWGGTEPFSAGLFASTEMLAQGVLELLRAGVLTRRAYPHPLLQAMSSEPGFDERPSLAWLDRFAAEGDVSRHLSRRDVAMLARAGVLRGSVRWVEGSLELEDGERVAADLADPRTRAALESRGLATRVRGAVVHAGFFVGSAAMYEALRSLDDDARERVRMKRISYVNELLGDEDTKRAQRSRARFFNSGLVATLLGAVASDALEDGRIVGGVGGQHDFVRMAHALEDGRSALLIRSTHERAGRVRSNIVWHHGRATIPRHLRDVVVTEYGIADLLGRTDREVVEAMLAVADSRFQPALARSAIAAGKLPRGYRIPDWARRNTPSALRAALGPFRASGAVPRLPFGSDVSDVEMTLIADLRALKAAWQGKRGLLPTLHTLACCWSAPPDAAPYLERMGLARPATWRERAMRQVVLYALARRDSIGRGA